MYVLDPQTQLAMQAYKQRLGELNGTQNFNAPFAVAPAPHQKIIEAYQQSTEFLGKINMILVKEAHGQKLGLGNNKPIAKTTDTRINPRRPTPLGELEAVDDYLCTQTDYDVAYDWATIDNWSVFADFQQKLANHAVKVIAQDKQRIGFNGTHRANTSNPELYPNLQDVNKGWLQKVREYSPERYLSKMTVGAGHEFKNLDALVEMMVHELIGEQYREGNDLVVIASSGLVVDKALGIINQSHNPTEQVAANTLYQRKKLGTLSVDTPSFFPTGSLMITSYDNLSIYQQKGSLRRHLKDEPEWSRTTDYQSVNESFVVEDYAKVALIDNLIVEA